MGEALIVRNNPRGGVITFNGRSGDVLPVKGDYKLSDFDITATAAEINKLDGLTASTAELNILKGVTATATEINKLDGLTPTVTELNYVDGVTSAIQTQLDGKLSLAGGTMTGNLVQKNLTLNDGKNNRTILSIYDDGDTANYGSELTLSAAGNTFIGSGESPTNWRTSMQGGTLVTNEAYTKSGESMYISSDGPIYFAVNCQTVANRKCVIIDATGHIKTPGYITGARVYGMYYSSSADYAEAYNIDDDIHPGELVMINKDGKLTKNNIRANTRILGIVSTDPASVIGSMDEDTDVPIAMSGRIPVYIKGTCEAGDFLIGSDRPGYLESVGNSVIPGAVVAQALETKTADDDIQVTVLVLRM